MYSETCLWDLLRIKDNLEIKDIYVSSLIYSVHGNEAVFHSPLRVSNSQVPLYFLFLLLNDIFYLKFLKDIFI